MTSRASLAKKKPRPGVGVERRTRQPLKIDKLPQEWREQIQKYRAQGSTWSEIEELSRGMEWDKLETRVLELFPEMKIPETNLIRWYDLRVEQVRKEILAEAEQARVIAEAFAGAKLDDTNEAVMNAMRDQVFALTRNAGDVDKKKLLGGLKDLSLLLARLQRIELQKRKLDADLARIDADREKAAADQLSAREMYLRATQEVLKKLRTYKTVREAIDPVQEELITEFANGAEAFARQFEARSA
jgi:hypothetical protein